MRYSIYSGAQTQGKDRGKNESDFAQYAAVGCAKNFKIETFHPNYIEKCQKIPRS